MSVRRRGRGSGSGLRGAAGRRTPPGSPACPSAAGRWRSSAPKSSFARSTARRSTTSTFSPPPWKRFPGCPSLRSPVLLPMDVLVPERLAHRPAHDVLRGDELDLRALADRLGIERLAHRGIGLREGTREMGGRIAAAVRGGRHAVAGGESGDLMFERIERVHGSISSNPASIRRSRHSRMHGADACGRRKPPPSRDVAARGTAPVGVSTGNGAWIGARPFATGDFGDVTPVS